MADWSELPMELVESIANRLDEPKDFLSLSAVCSSWRLVYLNKRWAPSFRNPILMLNESDENGALLRRFFSLSMSKVFKKPLPEAYESRCWGSCYGWIFTVNHLYKIFLVNPITRVSISLPSCCTLGDHVSNIGWFAMVNKATVFKIRGELVVLAIYGELDELALAKPGDTSWSTLRLAVPISFCSIACLEDQIFAVSMVGFLYFLQTDSHTTLGVKLMAAPPQGEKDWQQLHLVESSGNLLVVIVYGDINWMRKLKLRIYRFNFKARTWELVEELGDCDCALFVDYDFCFSVPASLCHKRNCVYFAVDNLEYMLTTDIKSKGQYMNMYDLKDKSFEAHSIDHYCCPIWFLPALW